MKSWLRCILIVNFRVRNKIPKIPNAHQIILKLFRKQNIKGYNKKSDGFSIGFFVYIPIGENSGEIPLCQRGI